MIWKLLPAIVLVALWAAMNVIPKLRLNRFSPTIEETVDTFAERRRHIHEVIRYVGDPEVTLNAALERLGADYANDGRPDRENR